MKKLDTQSKTRPTTTDIVVNDVENTSVKLFEEIKIMFKDLPSRLDKMTYSENKIRRRRLHPGMVEEMMHMNENPRLSIRIGLSFYKEILPWVYEEGNYLLNNYNDNSNIDAKEIYSLFKELLFNNKNMMLYDDYIMNNKDDYILVKELPMMILKSVEKLYQQKGRNLTTASTL